MSKRLFTSVIVLTDVKTLIKVNFKNATERLFTSVIVLTDVKTL